MKHVLSSVCLTALFTVISAVAVVGWVAVDDLSSTITDLSQTNFAHLGITRFKFEFTDNQILLKIDLSKPMSCTEVIDVLGIDTLFVKATVYSPVCTLVKPKYVVITYREVKQHE